MKRIGQGCFVLGAGLSACRFFSATPSLRIHAEQDNENRSQEEASDRKEEYSSSGLDAEKLPQEADITLPLRLRFVQVITRHGLRTPITSIPGDTAVWRCDHQQLSMLAKCNEKEENDTDDPTILMLHSEEEVPHQVPSHYLFRREFIYGRQALLGNCYKGQLTSEGLLQMKKLGEQLRDRYVNRLHLLSATFDPKQVYLRSTSSNRTFESAQSLMWGLFPPGRSSHDVAGVMVINMIDSRVENMYPRSRCKKLTKLKSEAKKGEEYLKHNKKVEAFQAEVEKALGKEISSWSALNSTLKSMQAHGFGLPGTITKEMAEKVDKEAGWYTARKYDTTLGGRLGIGTFIADVLHNMEHVSIHPEAPLRFALFSGHDNTLSPFLSAFKVLDGRQPDMATAIVLEQYEDAKGKHFVRLMYRGKDVLLPSVKQMDQLDGWRNVKKWRANNARLGIDKRALREVTIVAEPQHQQQSTVEGEKGEVVQEEMVLYPYEEFEALASLLIPVDYQKECEV